MTKNYAGPLASRVPRAATSPASEWPEVWSNESACRSCGGGLERVLSLGSTPLADRLVSADEGQGSADADLIVPLDLVRCGRCALVQLAQTVRRDLLFDREYPYHASVSTTVLDNAGELVQELLARWGVGPGSFVIEPASNDGYLLRQLRAQDVDVLGIDPARGPADAAARAGIPTMVRFFDAEVATELRDRGEMADVVVANNVLAHVDDLNGFVDALRTVSKPQGLIVVEVPYLLDMIEHCEFDTIYHQHLCYFSLTALDNLFRRHELFVCDVRRLAIHGGSLRLFVTQRDDPSAEVVEMLAAEGDWGVTTAEPYLGFEHRIERLRDDLLLLLRQRKAAGRRVVGYGAAAKATTLLAYCGIDEELIDGIVDANPVKQGKLMPGCRLRIESLDTLVENPPDDVLLLAWNHAAEILEQEAPFRDRGGSFIIPIPRPHVV